MTRVERDLAGLCAKYGATYHQTKKGHYKAVCNGRTVTVSSSPSDRNYLDNVDRDLRKASQFQWETR